MQVTYLWQRPSRFARSKAPGGYGSINQDGYRVVTNPATGKRMVEHRLVWETHNGPIPPNHHIHHINGNKTDNQLENLALVLSEEHYRKYHATLFVPPSASDETKTCPTCNRTLPLSSFYHAPKKPPTYRHCYCIECFRERSRKWKSENRKKVQENRKLNRRAGAPLTSELVLCLVAALLRSSN